MVLTGTVDIEWNGAERGQLILGGMVLRGTVDIEWNGADSRQ